MFEREKVMKSSQRELVLKHSKIKIQFQVFLPLKK